MESVDSHVKRVLSLDIAYLLGELKGVCTRLDELSSRSDDEARLESIVLKAYRAHLMEDLESLVSFSAGTPEAKNGEQLKEALAT
ncbi:MAG: hypothetical protein GU352_03290 [Acidilobus sp.]|nr:hypothetical protein [Acidilobus sp.]